MQNAKNNFQPEQMPVLLSLKKISTFFSHNTFQLNWSTMLYDVYEAISGRENTRYIIDKQLERSRYPHLYM